MLKAKVTVTGSKEFANALKRIEYLDLTDIGEIVRQRMVDIIDENRKTDLKQPEQRQDGKYSKHISDVIKVTPMSNGIGIGNIAELNKEVPYWRLINDGGKIKGEPTGAFLGGPGSSFFFSPFGFKMKPKKLIKAMKYIEKTQAWINQNLKRLLQDKISKAFNKTNANQRSLIRLKSK